jgi:hypothetical protein
MKRKRAPDFETVYKYFLNGGQMYAAHDRVYYFSKKERLWHYVEKESAVIHHTKAKEFLTVAVLKGVQEK